MIQLVSQMTEREFKNSNQSAKLALTYFKQESSTDSIMMSANQDKSPRDSPNRQSIRHNHDDCDKFKKQTVKKAFACCNSRIFYCLLFTVSFSLYNHEATFLVYKRSPSLSFFESFRVRPQVL